MFNFKKNGKKLLSSVLGAVLTIGSFLNTQIVKAKQLYREEYWDTYTMLSNAEFIFGGKSENEIKKLKIKFEEKYNAIFKKYDYVSSYNRNKELDLDYDTNKCKNELEEELGKLLNKNEKNIYDAIKKFIIDCTYCYNRLEESLNKISKMDKLKLSNDIKCKILKFKDRSEKEKAIVFVSATSDYCFEEKQIKKIVTKLKELGINGVDNYNFENVNLIFKKPNFKCYNLHIGYVTMGKLKNLTLNLQGSVFDKPINISDVTVNAGGSCFNNEVDIGENGTLNAGRSSFNCYLNADSGTVNADRSSFKGNVNLGKNAILNLGGSSFKGNVNVMKNSILNAGESNFTGNVTLEKNGILNAGRSSYKSVNVNGGILNAGGSDLSSFCDFNVQNGKVNIQDSNIFAKLIISNSELDASKSTFFNDSKIHSTKSMINLNNIKLLGEKANYKKLFDEMKESTFFTEKYITSGYKFFEDENSEEFKKYIVEMQEDQNKREVRDNISELLMIVPCFTFILFCLWKGCSSIKSFVESKFSSKKTIETPACKVKNPAI